MSRDFNKVVLMGRLARDPDVRYTPAKQKVARFTVCCGRQWKDKATGEKKEHTDFISVTAWSFTADVIEKYTKKGSQLLVEGRISTRDYDDTKTGEHKWVTEVVADNVVLLGNKQSGDGAATAQSPTAQQGDALSQYAEPLYTENAAKPKQDPVYNDDFPLDFSDLGGAGGGDVEIPF